MSGPWVDHEPYRGTEPAVEIRIPVEGLPSVIILAFNDRDEQRIRSWLDARPDLKQLVDWCAEYRPAGIRSIQNIIIERAIEGGYDWNPAGDDYEQAA